MLDKNQSVSLVKPHFWRIEQMVGNALERLKKFDGERHCLRKTSVANVFRDFLVDEARKVFGGLEAQGIKLIDQSDTSFFIEFSGYLYGLNGAAWARLKKVGKNFLTSNIPTQKAINFNTQKPIDYTQQPYLEGEDWQENPKPLQPLHLNIGHQWNELSTDVQAVVITAPNGRKSNAWYEQISSDGAAMQSRVTNNASNNNVAIFPVELEITGKKPKRIRAKENNENEETKEEKRVKKNARRS